MIRRARRLWSILAAVFLVTLMAVIAAAYWMQEQHLDGRSLAQPVDAAIVLGSGVDPDGVLSYSSRRRVAAAVGLLKQGKAGRLILSGGDSAAALMRDHAVSLGAPPGALLVEDRARSTFENLRFAFEIADRTGAARLALVTDSLHLARAAALARYLGRPGIGLVAVGGVEREPWHEIAFQTAREALAWWYNLGKLAAWTALDLVGVPEEERAGIVH